MNFKATLTDPNNNVFQTKEFAGMIDSFLSLERHQTFHTIQEFFNGQMHAFGKNLLIDGGREWLKGVQNLLGADAIITCLVEVDFKNTGVLETIYSGILAVGLFIETLEDDHLLQITLSQDLFWQKFIKRFDSKVNLQSRGDLDGNIVPPANFKPITLTCQKINKSYIAYRSKNAIIDVNTVTNPVILVGFDMETLKEIQLQSSISPSVISGGTGVIYPEPDKVVPFFNLIEDGELVIDNILLTMSQGDIFDDPNYATNADYINAKNCKCTKVQDWNLFLQKNNEVPIQFIQTDRAIPNSFVRNDGVVENLLGTPYVSDFTLPSNYILRITKYDSIKIYMINTFPAPVTIAKSIFYLWGQDGWDHSSGFDQLKNGQGCYQRLRNSGVHDESNKGHSSYGGLFNASSNAFPSTIDNDQGVGVAIQSGNWWNISDDAPGILGGVPVTGINVIMAKVNNPANVIGDWYIFVKTPYEGLENYAISVTSFQGYYDPTSGNFPALEKDGVTAIKAYDRWFISSLQVNLQGAYVDSTYIIQALFNAPGNVRLNWWISTREFYDSYFLADLPLQGFWDASVNLYPAFEADGASAIKQNDIWIISTGGSFGGVGGVPVDTLQVIRAKVNVPGQVNANWDVYTVEQWQIYIKSNLPTFNGTKIIFNSTYPDTVGQGFLLHDAFAAVCDRITGQQGLFTSPLLGNPYTAKSFVATGDFSLFSLFKGLQVRGYDLIEKPFFSSMKELWEGINNIACLALGKYKVGGVNQIVIKKRSEAYDKTMIVKLNWVQNIKKSYDDKSQYTSVKLGYSTWQSKDGANGSSGIPSGIDDMQTVQTRNTLFKNIGQQLPILSDLIAAALTFESTRRVSNKQSANFQYDDNIFIAALTSIGDGTFKPELSENFSEIDNLLNPNFRYNIRLSTFRNFIRHLDFISACLQDNPTSFFRFASGEGNYNMASKATSNYLGDMPGVLLTENQDINPSVTPLFLDEVFDIEHYLDWTCYKLLRDNPDMAIGISQTDAGHIPFCYDKLRFNFAEGKVTLTAKPTAKFNIKTIIDTGGTKKYYEPAYDPHYE